MAKFLKSCLIILTFFFALFRKNIQSLFLSIDLNSKRPWQWWPGNCKLSNILFLPPANCSCPPAAAGQKSISLKNESGVRNSNRISFPKCNTFLKWSCVNVCQLDQELFTLWCSITWSPVAIRPLWISTQPNAKMSRKSLEIATIYWCYNINATKGNSQNAMQCKTHAIHTIKNKQQLLCSVC